MRILDEVFDLGEKGVALFCVDGEPHSGMKVRDAYGQIHTVDKVNKQGSLTVMQIKNATESYFGRLLRDVRVDATYLEEVQECP